VEKLSQFWYTFHRTRIKFVHLLHPLSILYTLSDLQSIREENKEAKDVITQQQEQQSQSPVYSFMYALKSSEARRQYPKRLKMLFDFLGLPETLEEPAKSFLDKSRRSTMRLEIKSSQYLPISA
jgi:hypothetical protein